MEDPADIDLRCSVILFKDDSVLLIHRIRDGVDDWVLPGGTPRQGESMTSCARRETLEETGLPVEPGRVAFVLEALGPEDSRRIVDLVFLAELPACTEPGPAEDGLDAQFVPLNALPLQTLRPPIAGHLRALHARGPARTAAYLGNLWRPGNGNGASLTAEAVRDGVWELGQPADSAGGSPRCPPAVSLADSAPAAVWSRPALEVSWLELARTRSCCYGGR